MTAIKNRSPYICLFFRSRDNLRSASISCCSGQTLLIFFRSTNLIFNLYFFYSSTMWLQSRVEVHIYVSFSVYEIILRVLEAILYLVWWETVKNQSGFIRDQNDSNWKSGLDQYELRFIRIENLIFFASNFIKRDAKCIFWLVQNKIPEWFGIVLIRFEWISIRYFRQGDFPIIHQMIFYLL